MSAASLDWRLWFPGGPVPEQEDGSDTDEDSDDTDPDSQWWRASHRGNDNGDIGGGGGGGAGHSYWAVDQRVLTGRLLEDAVRHPSQVADLLGFLPYRLLAPLADGLPDGLRRLGPARNAPTAEVAAAAEVAMVSVDGLPVMALEWRADGHVVVGFAWDGRLVAAIRPAAAHPEGEPPAVRFVSRSALGC